MKSIYSLRTMAGIALALLLSNPSSISAADTINRLTSDEKRDGWKLLFDGESLKGWRGYKKSSAPTAGWKVEDGLLRKLPKERGGDIITEATFDDFELAWDWRLTAGGNNGVKYLVTEQRSSAPGHEYQMIDDSGHPDGKLGPKRQTASFYEVLAPDTSKALRPVGQWNSSRIVVRGQHIEHWLNGVKVLEYELGSDEVKAGLATSKFKNTPGFGEKIKGHIMLTDHQDECWFRNIKIRTLPGK